MNLVVLSNPRSGRGRSSRRIAELLRSLADDGHRVISAAMEEPLGPVLRGADVLIVAGGDGSVNYAATSAVESGVPVYHFPLGTENLFAREFGMKARTEECIASLRAGRVKRVDLAMADDRAFVIMLSAGFDAGVVHRVAAARTAGVSRWDYVRRIAGSLPGHQPPSLTVSADDRIVVDRQRGLLIVANSRQYAARLDPAAHAVMDDGLLDGVFIPASGPLDIAASLAGLLVGLPAENRGAKGFRARRLSVVSHEPADVQMDGEAVTLPERFAVTVRPRALNVLMPA